MYLSRSHIINRDPLAWIERKKWEGKRDGECTSVRESAQEGGERGNDYEKRQGKDEWGMGEQDPGDRRERQIDRKARTARWTQIILQFCAV